MLPFRLHLRRQPAASGIRWRRAWSGWWQEVTDSARDLLFPPHCAFCESPLAPRAAGRLCEDCTARLTPDRPDFFCLTCGSYLPRPTTACLACRGRTFRFAQALPLGAYYGDLRRAVIRMKQFHQFVLATAVGQLWAERAAPRLIETPDVAVSVPKYWVRRLWDGSNSAEVLAEAMAADLRIPVETAALQMCRKTKKQSLLSFSERQRNLRDALRVRRGYDFTDAHVLLVDDIMTTGATADEAARVLRRRGARRVSVAVAARALHPARPPQSRQAAYPVSENLQQ